MLTQSLLLRDSDNNLLRYTLAKTRNSAIADKPRDAFRGQSRPTND